MVIDHSEQGNLKGPGEHESPLLRSPYKSAGKPWEGAAEAMRFSLGPTDYGPPAESQQSSILQAGVSRNPAGHRTSTADSHQANQYFGFGVAIKSTAGAGGLQAEVLSGSALPARKGSQPSGRQPLQRARCATQGVFNHTLMQTHLAAGHLGSGRTEAMLSDSATAQHQHSQPAPSLRTDISKKSHTIKGPARETPDGLQAAQLVSHFRKKSLPFAASNTRLIMRTQQQRPGKDYISFATQYQTLPLRAKRKAQKDWYKRGRPRNPAGCGSRLNDRVKDPAVAEHRKDS